MKKTYKIMLILVGSISLGLGIIGIFLPLLPTTPFLLLTAICFSKGSSSLHQKLMNSSLGHYIINYKKKKAIPIKVKIIVITMLWTSAGSSLYFLNDRILLKIIIIFITLLASIHIGRLKTLKKFEY